MSRNEAEAVAYVKHGYETRKVKYFIDACSKLEKAGFPSSRTVHLHSFTPTTTEAAVGPEQHAVMHETAGKVLEVLSRLGDKAESALSTLIFKGFKKGITSSIEGLSDQEKDFLEKLLDEP